MRVGPGDGQQALDGLEPRTPSAGRSPTPTPARAARVAKRAAEDAFLAGLPRWLADALEATNPPTRSAVPRLVPCHRCGAAVLKAEDSTWDGCCDVVADPRLLVPAQELAVLLAGGGSAELEVGRWGSRRLFSRDRWLAGSHPSVRGRFLVPVHRCNEFPGVAMPWELVYPELVKSNLGAINERPSF